MVDFFSVLKVGTIGIVHVLFKNKIARRRIIKNIKKLDINCQENVEEMLTKIKELKPLFVLKTGMKYVESLDLDKQLDQYLTRRGIDISEITEAFSSFTTKTATKKMSVIVQSFGTVDRITELKEQKMKADIKTLKEGLDSVLKSIDTYKIDYKNHIEKKLIDNTDEINAIDVQKIKETAIKEFLAAQSKNSLKLGGIKVGGRQKLKR
jgi:hypothetical protein